MPDKSRRKNGINSGFAIKIFEIDGITPQGHVCDLTFLSLSFHGNQYNINDWATISRIKAQALRNNTFSLKLSDDQ